MPHPQQAAMMSQLPSNRQTMVQPTQPVYIIPQPQVTSGMQPAPSVAAATFQPTQFGTRLIISQHILAIMFWRNFSILCKAIFSLGFCYFYL